MDKSGAPDDQPQPLAEVEKEVGKSLLLARESRRLTREQAASEAHLPVHYVRMMEGGDYTLISDRLYLLPFIRRYAAFLGLEAEEIAMRFVGEVQRFDNSAPKASVPIALDRKRRRSVIWAKVAVLVLVMAAGWLYLVNFERHRRGTQRTAAPSAPPSSPALASPAAKPLFSIAPPSPAPATSEPPLAAPAAQAPSQPHTPAIVTR